MTALLWCWAGVFAALLAFFVGDGRRVGPLVLTYFLGLSLIHVPGAAASLGATVDPDTAETTARGFTATVIGMAAFVGGAMLMKLARFGFVSGNSAESKAGRPSDARNALLLMVVGLAAYFVLIPIGAYIPSFNSIAVALLSMLSLGLGWYVLVLVRERNVGGLVLVVVLLPVLPVATAVFIGFAGNGAAWVMAGLCALYVFSPRKPLMLIAMPFVMMFSLSAAIAYFGERMALRDVVWLGVYDSRDRFDIVSEMAKSFEWLDVENPRHAEPLLTRLNESQLIGLGVQRYSSGAVELLGGASVPLWALVPRVIWPDKPPVGGGGDLVAKFIGVDFAEGTSVGAGQVLEFYMNFGMVGVVVGLALMGALLGWLDIGLRGAMDASRTDRILLMGLPGTSLIQPNGNLLEIVVSFAAAVAVALLVGRLLAVRNRRTEVGVPTAARDA